MSMRTAAQWAMAPAAIGLALSAAAPASAGFGSSQWINALGGFFRVAENWSDGVPGPVEIAEFSLDAVYDVEFATDQPDAVFNAALEVNTGDVTWNFPPAIDVPSRRGGPDGFLYSVETFGKLSTPGTFAVGGEFEFTDSASLTINGGGGGEVRADTLFVGAFGATMSTLAIDDGLFFAANDPSGFFSTIIGNTGDGALIVKDASFQTGSLLIGNDFFSKRGFGIPVIGEVVLENGFSNVIVDGAVDVYRGTLELRGGVVEQNNLSGEDFFFLSRDGEIRGFGVIDSPEVFGPGTVCVTDPSGQTPGGVDLFLSGDFSQADLGSDGPFGTLKVEVVGGQFGADARALDAAGELSLGGTLIVNALDPGLLEDSTQLEGLRIVFGGSFSEQTDRDRFGVVALPSPTDGVSLRIDYNEFFNGVSVSLRREPLTATIDPLPGPAAVVGGRPLAGDLGDLDGDGFPELVLTIPNDTNPAIRNGQLVILRNLGNDQTDPMNPFWLGFDDANPQVITVGNSPSAVELGEYDGNPGLDIAVANKFESTVEVFANDGLGVFPSTPDQSIATPGGPCDLFAADLDGDSDTDLAVALGFSSEVLFLENLLTARGFGGFAFGGAVGLDGVNALGGDDLDNDKDIDIVTGGGTAGEATVLRNVGNARAGITGINFDVEDAIDVGGEATDVVIVDLDGDGFPEPAISTGPGNAVSVLPNDNGQIDGVGPVPLNVGPRALAGADLDGDGDPDLIATPAPEVGGSISVLRNDSSPVDGIFLGIGQTLGTLATPAVLLTGDLDQDGTDDVVSISTISGDFGARGGGGTFANIETLLDIPAIVGSDGPGKPVGTRPGAVAPLGPLGGGQGTGLEKGINR
ncbi:MAG: VCBS repeat-containing protein [Planctomycetota bacterium]